MPLPEASPHRFSDVRWLAEIDSTNRYLLDAARAGAPDGLVVVADHQTAGRGRLGRTWVRRPARRCWSRCCCGPSVSPADAPPGRDGGRGGDGRGGRGDDRGASPVLKWPNDLLVGDRKLAGILAEAAGDAVVVGIGVNLDWPTSRTSSTGSPPPATSKAADPSPARCSSTAFLAGYSARLDDLERRGAAYEARLVTLGRKVRVERADGALIGIRAISIQTVACSWRPSGAIETISAGDVVHLRPI